MNAYELADELEIVKNKIQNEEHELAKRAIIFYTEAANMLRQQADKLKKYELRNLAQCDRIAILEAQNKQQADRIAELEKPHKYDPETGEPLIDGYPLFSGLPRPQTKPLSDEEITKLHLQCWDEIEFARAIEAKVRGEK
jgi:hypothetical protein